MPNLLSRSIGMMVVCAVVLLVLGWVFYFVRQIAAGFTPPREDTDVGHYASLLAHWAPSGLTGHFPRATPPGATEVRVSAIDPFLQGGGHFQLHVVLPAAEVARIEQDAAGRAAHIYPGGGEIFTQVNSTQPGAVATSNYYTAKTQPSGFPPSFTFYVLSVSHGDTHATGWNHASTTGIAISSSTNEVVYWLDDW